MLRNRHSNCHLAGARSRGIKVVLNYYASEMIPTCNREEECLPTKRWWVTTQHKIMTGARFDFALFRLEARRFAKRANLTGCWCAKTFLISFQRQSYRTTFTLTHLIGSQNYPPNVVEIHYHNKIGLVGICLKVAPRYTHNKLTRQTIGRGGGQLIYKRRMPQRIVNLQKSLW